MTSFKSISFAIVHIFVVANFLRKGFCDDVCPHGITKITGEISGEIEYPSSGTYGVNETKCWRIEVPKPYAGIKIIYHRLEIEECADCACDSFGIGCAIHFGRLYCSTIRCGRYSSDYLNYDNRFQGTRLSDVIWGQNVDLRLKTDKSIHYSGIKISFIVASDNPGIGKQTFLNVSSGQISTPKFGLEKYSANFNWGWYLLAPEGHQIQIKFESFELEQSDDCQKDYLEIREAYFRDPNNPIGIEGVFGVVLARPICGTDLPREIHSAGNMVWVHFHSDSNAITTYKGFNATFTSSESTTLSISYASSLVFLVSLITVTAI